jgi:hypothetical protein
MKQIAQLLEASELLEFVKSPIHFYKELLIMEVLYKKILVPVDGSVHSRKALSHAVALARSFAAEIGILYVSVLSQQVPSRELKSRHTHLQIP